MRDLASPIAGPPTFTWFGDPPQGPGVPFGNAALVVFDSMRLICLAFVAISVVFAIMLVARSDGAVGQRIRFASQAGLAILVASIEVEHFGDYANLRLIAVLLITLGAAWGNYLGIRYEALAQPDWHTPESGQS
jgi:hypothetical protein